METLVNMYRDIGDLISKYVPGTNQMDRLFSYFDNYYRTILWCTYPELNKQEIEVIEELMAQDATAEQILTIMGLEDRSNKMECVINDLSDMEQWRWDSYLKEEILAEHCRGYFGLSQQVDDIMRGVAYTIGEDSITMEKAWERLQELR